MAGEVDLGAGSEADVVRAFLLTHQAGRYDEAIPCSQADTIITEMVFKYGRADIVVFHVDGTASVIEAKDGAKGYTHVVGGIGQAALYAAQLAMTKGAVRFVRKCLMWSSTGEVWLDALICTACESAGVVPMPMQAARSLKISLAAA